MLWTSYSNKTILTFYKQIKILRKRKLNRKMKTQTKTITYNYSSRKNSSITYAYDLSNDFLNN